MSDIRVLIVEDVDSMRSLLEHVVNGIEGVQASSLAANIWEARLELDRHRPDIVLLDEILPGEASLDFLVEVRKEGIPVILITGVENPEHPVPEGAECRLSKPGWDDLDEGRETFAQAIQKALK